MASSTITISINFRLIMLEEFSLQLNPVATIKLTDFNLKQQQQLLMIKVIVKPKLLVIIIIIKGEDFIIIIQEQYSECIVFQLALLLDKESYFQQVVHLELTNFLLEFRQKLVLFVKDFTKLILFFFSIDKYNIKYIL